MFVPYQLKLVIKSSIKVIVKENLEKLKNLCVKETDLKKLQPC